MAGLWGFESLPAPYVAKDRPGRTNDWIGSAVGNVGSALVAAWERNQLREEKKAEKQAQMELAKQKEAREQEQMKSLMGWRKAQAENLLSAREQAAQKAEMERRKEELAPYEGFAKTLPQEQEFAPLQAELEATRARHGQPERLEGPATEAGEVPMGTFTAREQVARMAPKRGPALETMQAREDAAKLRQKTAGRRPEAPRDTPEEKDASSEVKRLIRRNEYLSKPEMDIGRLEIKGQGGLESAQKLVEYDEAAAKEIAKNNQTISWIKSQYPRRFSKPMPTPQPTQQPGVTAPQPDVLGGKMPWD